MYNFKYIQGRPNEIYNFIEIYWILGKKEVSKEIGDFAHFESSDYWIICEHNKSFAGCLCCREIKKSKIELTNFYVLDGFRNKGICGNLVSIAIDLFKKELIIISKNEIVFKIAEKNNFKIYSKRGSWKYFNRI